MEFSSFQLKAIFLAITISFLFSPAQADRNDHSGHDGGSQGGNLNSADKVYEICNKHEASCVGAVNDGSKKPSECWKNKNCDYVVAISKQDKHYKFSLFGKLSKRSGSGSIGYVGVGLSKDGKDMAKTSIVQCSSIGGETKLDVTWSEGKGKPRTLSSDATSYISYADAPEIYNNDLISCEFYRDAKSKVEGNEFDLDNEKYKILLAVGSVDNNGNIEYHSSNRVISDYMLLKTANAASSNSLIPSLIFFLTSFVLAWH